MEHKENYKSAISFLMIAMLLMLSQPTEAATADKTHILQSDTTSVRVVKGKITDEFGTPVAAAVITFRDQKNFKSQTDGNGAFLIRQPIHIKYLSVTHRDYLGQTVDLSTAGDDLTIILKRDNSNKDERISQPLNAESSRRGMTGAISQVQGEELVRTPAASLSSTLAGRLPGLIVSQSSQQPYSDNVSLLVRGRSTINGTGPLLVLDGVPSPLLDISMINPEEISSITVLKDAAETAIYGYQGSNGVVLITSKKGLNAPHTSITFNANHALQEAIVKPTILPSWEYATLRNQAHLNDGIFSLPFTQQQIEQYRNPDANRELYPDNNWYDLFTKDYARLSRYNIGVRSGTDRVKYFLNAGYLQQGSLLETQKQDRYDPKYELQRFTARANVEVKVLDNLNAFLYQSVIIDRRNRPSASLNSILSNIFAMPATENGPLTPNGDVISTPFVSSPAYGQINKGGYSRETITDYHGTLGLDLNMGFITKGLSAKAFMAFETKYFGTVSGSRDYPRFIRDGVVQTPDGRDSVKYIPYGSSVETPLSLGRSSMFGYFMNLNGMINYSRVFNQDHAVEGLLNYFAQNYVTVYSGGAIQGTIPYDRIALGSKLKYSYKSKYIAQFTAGYTISDQFAPGRRAGFFPAISAAWIASEEDFLKSTDTWLSYLKLRGSYGLTGNDQLPNPRFSYKDYITSTSGGPIGGLFMGSLIRENSIANPMVSWEKQKQINIGLDFGLFNALSIRLDAFKQSQTNISIQSNLVPSMQGIPSSAFPYINTGLIENSGIEAELSYTKQISRDFRMSLTGNMMYVKNKVVDIAELNRGSSGFHYPYRSTGQSIGQHFGYLIDYSNGNGYFNSPQEIIDRKLTYDGTKPRPGDFIYQDLNGDGIIDSRDEAPIALQPTPEIIYAGTIGLEFKNFDLYLQLQGIARASSYYSGEGINENGARGQFFPIHRDAWTPERYANEEEITYPALATQSSSSLRPNDFFIQRRDYLRLKVAELGYNIKRVFGPSQTSSMRVFVSGQNLLTFSSIKFDAIDPEGGSFTTYPIYRTFNAGLSIQF
jgi:TonB-linked SusC/RagA family outer membrane protein